MVRTRLTAAEPYTSGHLEVVVDLEPDDTVGSLEAALTGLPPSPQTRLWLGERELDREAPALAAGVRDGVLLSVGGPARRARSTRAPHELRLVSGPQAGIVLPLAEGDTVIGGPGADLALEGLAGPCLQLQIGPAGVVASSLDPDRPVRRAGVPLMTAVALDDHDQLDVGHHLVAVGRAVEPPAELAAATPAGLRAQSSPEALGTRALQPPEPPAEPPPPRFPLVPALFALVPGLVLGLAVSTWFLALALAAPLLIYASRWREERRSAAAYDAAVAQHDQALAELAAEVSALRRSEVAALRAAAPDPVTVLRAAARADVWERSRSDADSLVLRVGTSTTHATSWRVADQPAEVLHDVPVTLSLRRAGVVAISGSASRSTARWLVAQAAVQHSPEDLAIWLLADPAGVAEGDWDWLRWLPHNHGSPQRCANLIGVTDEGLMARTAELMALLAERRACAQPGPHVLLVLDGDVCSLPGVPELLRDGPSLGIFALCVSSTVASTQSRTTVTTSSEGRLTVTGTGVLPVRDVRADLVGSAWAQEVGRALAPLRSAEPAAGPLPSSVPLTTLIGPSAVADRWATQGAALVGTTEQGPLELDLAAGPHALVAGSAAEHTSCLLHTIVVSLALSRPPEALNLVLLGKGLEELRPLPHVSTALATVDEWEATRVLASMEAERRRREALLASAGAADFQAFRANGREQLPRLVVIVQEVGELPDLVSGLVGLLHDSGRVGMHVVMSTSNPQGVPREIIDATSIRLALRLDDTRSADLVVGAAAPTTLLPDLPLRGYARFGDHPLVPFHAATLTTPRTTAREPLHAEELPWSRLELPLAAPPMVEPTLPAVLSALLAAGASRPVSPWCEPLPPRVHVEQLDPPEGSGLTLAFGLEDLPAEQAQRTAAWDLAADGNLIVVGAGRSGRSTMLLTLAASLARTCSPSVVHAYALDCGNGALQPLSRLPHCGAVVPGDDTDRADRLLTRLAAEVMRRRRLLADRGFTDLAAQRQGTADPLPYLVLMVDGWEGFTASLGRVGDGRLVDTLVTLLREGGPTGLRIIITGDHSLLASEVVAGLPDRLVLRLDDASHYELAGLQPSSVPPQHPVGRAFRSRAGEAIRAVDSIQIAVLDGDLETISQALPAARGRKPFRVDSLPRQLAWSAAHDLPLSGPGVGFAVGGDELRLQAVNLLTCGPGFTVAGPSGSGRSTALVVLARGLLEAGVPVCLVTPRPSPLSELRGAPGVLPGDDLAGVLQRTQGPLVVVVDDADQLPDAEVGGLLEQLLATARARDRALVLAGETELLSSTTKGFAFDARRSRSGLLLCPSAPDDGELLGVRLDRAAVFSGPVGRGLLIRSGDVQLVQVPTLD